MNPASILRKSEDLDPILENYSVLDPFIGDPIPQTSNWLRTFMAKLGILNSSGLINRNLSEAVDVFEPTRLIFYCYLKAVP